jgi:MOSC domain-containing protein YiiM
MGTVEAITLVLDSAGATTTADSVEAAAGRGLEGDYHDNLTLIAAESLEGLQEDTGIGLTGEQSRRNVLTRGIDLNALVGKRFTVGEVEAIGVELAEPCTKLQRISGEPGVLRGLVHRGGLRADVVSGGTISVGDAVRARDAGR